MPELPEVETIRRELRPEIINKRIIGCRVLRKDIIGYPNADRFCKGVINETIIDVQRRAKYLIVRLTSDKSLIFHLRLSGRIFVLNNQKGLKLNGERVIRFEDGGDEEVRFVRLILELEGRSLIFSEPRALGRVYLLKNGERPGCLSGFFKLGYEPISPEFDFNYFKERLKNRKAMIKSILLDQSICAGVGNIYSDEALFHSNIRPTRRASSLKTEEVFKLLIALKDVINKGIEEFGTTVSDYKRTNGRTGNFQNFLYVYGREGKLCKVCGSKIVLKKIGNRATRYCPKCQR
uniref:Bifunctional DNA-formamidopyrimidine glycosylase/DNA-(Apurinic or apyrimidinic site) lyase n=1 Tax=candidate division WOR-3 bacterium TaxID=2052148 RepID=A0A7V3RHA6_UNCW3